MKTLTQRLNESVNYDKVDKHMKSIFAKFKEEILDLKYNELVSKVSRIASDLSTNPQDTQKYIDYIFDNYVPTGLIKAKR